MTHPGTAHYHVHSSTPQAFRIDPGGVVGKLVGPELRATRVEVEDVRDGDAVVTMAEDGVSFLHAPTAVSGFDGDAWRADYARELEALLSRALGARAVRVFDHTVRVDDPAAERRPARNVHGDYSPHGAERRLVDLLGETEAEAWRRGHYAFVNVWRPVGAAVARAPLGFVRPRTVSPEDWVPIGLTYPDRTGHIMGLVANPRHEWVYRSKMTPDEVVVFTTYDSRGRPPVAHSAIDLVEDQGTAAIRRSIESRTLVRY